MNLDWLRSRVHHGVVLDVSSDGFDEGAATFSSVFVDRDDPDTVFMFYGGAEDVSWSHSAIGLAVSRDFVRFRKVKDNPILEGARGSFFGKEALTPAVTRIGNRFFMVFSGRPSEGSFRRLGLAWADDPGGPWRPIMELAEPFSGWANGHLENGPSMVKLKDDTVLVYCSNTSSAGLDAVNFLRQLFSRGSVGLAWFDVPTFLRRYLVRRVGLLKLRIHGTSRSDIETCRFSGNSIKLLNGPKGSWNESLFCPGYFRRKDLHYLVPATSAYSDRHLCRRYIGIVAGNSPFFDGRICGLEKLIDGPVEKARVVPGIAGEISLDSPSPFLADGEEVLYLYYSVMDSKNSVWKTALTTFKFRQE